MCEHEQQTKFFESAHNYFLVVAAASAVLPIQILRLSGEVNTILISLSTGQHLTHKTELNDKLQENVSINWERMVRSKTRGFMRLYLRSHYFVLVVIFIDIWVGIALINQWYIMWNLYYVYICSSLRYLESFIKPLFYFLIDKPLGVTTFDWKKLNKQVKVKNRLVDKIGNEK